MSGMVERTTADEIKRIDIAEFRRDGYLQEVNRRFLHPLGLALEIVVDDETGDERLGGVWDYREDPEGIYFAGDYSPDADKAQAIDREWNAKLRTRTDALGYMVQPVGDGS